MDLAYVATLLLKAFELKLLLSSNAHLINQIASNAHLINQIATSAF